MRKKIFITGGTGCIGSYITDRFLSDNNYELHMLVRNPSRLKFNYKKYSNIIIHTGDIGKIEEHKRNNFQSPLYNSYCNSLGQGTVRSLSM